MRISQLKWAKLFVLKMLFIMFTVTHVYAETQTAAPAAPAWGLDPITGTLLQPGIAVHTLGALDTEKVAGDGDHTLKFFDTRTPNRSATRPVNSNVDVYIHHNWDAGSIGNVFGIAIDKDRYVYTTATVHFSSYFGYQGTNNAKVMFGSIGAGIAPDTVANDNNPGTLNDLNAAGTVYKLDKITGDVSVFAQLPQHAYSFNQQACEQDRAVLRNTGPALGNIAYDPIHDQMFVSNFDDGKIYRLDMNGNTLNTFQPTGFNGLVPNDTTTTGKSPYGLAVNPDGTKLFFGTNEINIKPQLFAINLDTNGNFVGTEIDQHAKLIDDLQYTQNIGGGFVGSGGGGSPVWLSYSDLKFNPEGELIIGLRTGCRGHLATSHNHGGAYYLLKQDANGLYNTPADKVPGNGTSYTVMPQNADGANPEADSAGQGRYDAGAIPIYTDKNSGVGELKTGPDDGYGGVAIYDKGDGTYDYLVTSSDITVENGPHGFMSFPHNFTLDTSAANIVGPMAAYPSIQSSDTSAADRDYKGIGGDIEVLSVLMDWGDAPDTYSTDLYVGNSTNGTDVRGPSHIITADGIFLGVTVDDEFNGAPSVGADGDDTIDSPDDEDGISSFPTLRPGATSYTIPIANITAANSSGGDVTIHAWIDFDGNGVFDADEYTSTTVVNGATSPSGDLSWSGPGVSGVTSGRTYARFRITNDVSIDATTPGGRASNGEVEDYPIDVPYPVTLGSVIWEDVDGDGIQDAGEAKIAGAKVNLLVNDGAGNFIVATDLNGNAVVEQTTGADGKYYFTNLPEGEYKVTVEVAASYVASPNQNVSGNADANGANDSNIDTSVGTLHTSGAVTLTAGTEPTEAGGFDGDDQDDGAETNGNMTVDFGFVQPMSLGSVVWEDKDRNGLQGTAVNEPRIAGAKVNLLVNDGAGNFIAATDLNGNAVVEQTTGADGKYYFTNLPAGEYKVLVDVPGNYQPTPTQDASGNADANGVDDSNIESSTGTVHTSSAITLTAGNEPTEVGGHDGDDQDDGTQDTSGNMTVDFGFVQPMSLGSVVWEDKDRNGLQGTAVNEPRIAGAKVNLLVNDGAGNFIAATDLNGNAVVEQTTGADGKYYFTNLPEGEYKVTVEKAGFTASPTQDASGNADANGVDDSNIDTSVGDVHTSGAITLSVGTEPTEAGGFDGDDQDDSTETNGNMTVDFGLVQTVSLGSVIWEDVDGDGIQDAGEAKIAGAKVNLLVNDGAGNFIVATDLNGNSVVEQTTGADGKYYFTNLPEGEYKVTVEVAASYVASPNQNVSGNADANGANDSNIDTSVGTLHTSGAVTLIAGTEPTEAGGFDGDDQDDGAETNGNMTVDFGFFPLGIWSGNVSIDTNNDDTGDVPFPAIVIELFTDPNGDGDPSDGVSVGTTTTNAAGDYNFTNLTPGDYVAVETQDPAYLDVSEDEGGADNDKPDNAIVNAIAGTVDAGETDTNNDFVEEEPLGAISGNVSKDTNNDDAGDENLSGVTIELFADTDGDGQPDGAAIATTVTDADGNFVFADLQPGDYVVVETQPAGLNDVSENEGGADDDKPDNGTINSIAATVNPGETDTNNDFVEEEPLGAISGNVSKDTNNDDAGDENLSGVTIELFADTDGDGQPDGAAIATTVTDADGNFVFADLQPGDYVVVETQPAGLNDVSENEGGADDDKPDNGTINSIAATVNPGETDTNNDFVEEEPLGAISGNVSKDTNNDDAGDENLSGVTIELFADTDGDGQPDGAAIATTVTDADGNFVFADLQPGDYVVVETQPAGLNDVSENEGGADDDKPDNGTINSIAATVNPGETDTNNDFVEEEPLGAISGNVSKDTNNDDAGDENLSGVTIELFADTDGDGQPDGAAIATTVTDADGNFVFADLQPGDYVVVETQPAGLNDVSENEGGADDDKPDNGTINSIAATVNPGETDTNNDFVEEEPLGAISGNVSKDTNNDDAGDENLSGVTIELFADTDGDGQPDGAAIATTVTDADGNFVFADLQPGDYVVVETQPAGLNDVSENEGGADDDKPDNGTINSIAATVNPGETDTNNDFVEEEPLGAISGNVSKDTNNDDAGDENLSGVTIELFADTDGDGQPDGAAIATTVTDADGNFVFADLQPGDYVVVETQPAGLNDVSENEGGADDDKPDNGTINSIAATVNPGETDTNNDFVEEEPLGAISGNVSKDTNNDDAGDENLSGVTIELFADTDGDGQPDGAAIATTVTDADGNFVFADLQPGDYVVVETQPAGLNDVSENEGGADDDKPDNGTINSIAATVNPGETDTNNDFVEEEPLGAISGNVSKDTNNDDAGDENLSGVTIELFADTDGDGQPDGAAIATTVTDADGNFVFADLQPGDYVVVETQPAGLNDVSENEGGADDDKPDNGTINSIAATVNPGETDTNNDFVEEEPLGAISGNVSKDTNNDDAGDENLSGVTIELFADTDGDGQPDGAAIATTVTDADGNFVFADLQPGDYVVVETQPAGLNDVSENEGGADDDKPDNGTINSIAATVDAGETDTNNDFVEEAPGSWSGNVSKDNDNDDIGDENLAGVSIELFTDPNGDGNPADGVSVGTTTTDANGNYSFTGLTPGDYVAVETQPAGLLDVSENEGGADNDKPDNAIVNAIAGTVDAGENDSDNDFVEEAVGSLTGNVSHENNNGLHSMQGVVITLHNPDGSAVLDDHGKPLTIITDSNGNYEFINLVPADYIVREEQPDGFFDVRENEGGFDDDNTTTTGVNEISATVGAGENDINNDFVEAEIASLGDLVWYDSNNDGIQDSNETGVDSVRIYLLDANGDRIQHNGIDIFTETNSTGEYLFEGLNPLEEYAVEFDLSTIPNLYEITIQDNGNSDLDDSDADHDTGKTVPVTLAAGEHYSDLDMGIFAPTAHIGDYFWIDRDQNGIQNPGEEPVISAMVELFDENGDPVTDVHGNHQIITDANGKYGFDVPPGTYQVRFTIPKDGYKGYIFSSEDQGGDDASDTDVNNRGFTQTVTVAAGQNNLTLDAGINCGCANASIKSNGGDTLGLFGILSMIFMTLMTALLFVRKEDEQRN